MIFINKKDGAPKIIVLGIDGLDYYLVKKWGLKYLLQKTTNKLDLSGYKVIVTPPIWGSMMTGKIDEEIMDKWFKRCQIYGDEDNIDQKWWAKIGQNILPNSVNKWILKNFFKNHIASNIFQETCNYIVDKNEDNIFDFFKNPWTNGVPGYKWDEDFKLNKKLLSESIAGNKEQYISYLHKEYNKNKKQLIDALEENTHDFVFWYARIVDSICHAYNIKPLKLMDYYIELNNFVGEIVKKYADSKIYIISDHGMEKRDDGFWWHSKYSFFSSNTDENIVRPTELYNLIKKHATVK